MTMHWAVENLGDGRRIFVSGAITEEADFQPLIALGGDGRLSLDLAGVEEINSCGVREWIHFVRRLSEQAPSYDLVRCSPAIVRQLNMVSNFRGSGRVGSVMLPYYCGGCGEEQFRLLELPPEGASPAIANFVPCTSCGGEAEFDDLPESYVGFLARTQNGSRKT